MSQYAEVILPLALGDGLTYGIPPALQPQLRVGYRVLVPLGRSKVYAGIVSRLHDDAPPSGVALKEIIEIVDNTPRYSQKDSGFGNGWQIIICVHAERS